VRWGKQPYKNPLSSGRQGPEERGQQRGVG
jgi:hypothetical protein